MARPGREITPEPQAGERVVFVAHFERGFGLPVSTFLCEFLDFHHLQPHHLAANAVMTLSGFVTMCEGYLGVRPSLGLWKRLFHLRSHMAGNGIMIPNPKAGGPSAKADEPPHVEEKVMTDCGGCIIYPNRTAYPTPKPIQSCKEWQTTFFYVKSPANGPDCHNLPEFELPPPTAKYQWATKVGAGDVDLDEQVKRMEKLVSDGLRAADLVAAWITLRVLPLQRRVHRMCDMGSRKDPTRITTHQLTQEEVRARVVELTDAPCPDPFEFGMECYSRKNPSLVVLSDP